MYATQIEGGIIHFESGILISMLQMFPEAYQFLYDLYAGIQCISAFVRT